ncbi:MAG TPA: CopD family protein [Ktedonobacterales bacterium]|nr:CopD family protein [Ktedonobacterales bacterium]
MRLRPIRRVVIACALALFFVLLFGGVASAHALLSRSDPASGEIIDYGKAPSQLRIWFTEEINPALTSAVVVNHANKEVDLKNSHVNASDPRELDTGLQQLPPDFYVVIWKSVSAEDGHATGGSFLFRVRYQNGSVPALPSELPTGPSGFANTSAGQCLTGPTPLLCVPQVASDWLVYLAATIWIGGMLWQFFIVELAARRDPSLVATALVTARRFRRVSLIALVVYVVTNITYVIGQAMLAGGSVGSGFSPAILSGNLLHSSFGIFWIVRELLGLLALLWLVARPDPIMTEENWQPRVGLNWARMALGLLLLVAMSLSGHAAAAQVQGGIASFAVPVDWLHLLSTSLWVGGIIFIAMTLMPAIWDQESADRARGLVKLLPRFSVIALVSVAIASLSGSYNADVHLTSWSQFIDTTYGRTLIVKILLVCVMILISAYHAFRLRPRLARALRAWDRLEGATQTATANGQATGTRASQPAQPTAQSISATSLQQANQQAAGQSGSTGALPRSTIPLRPFTLPTIPALKALGTDDETLDDGFLTDEEEETPQEPQTNGDRQRGQKAARIEARMVRLSEQIRIWIRREALLGTGVLLCASLLGGLAGSLAPTPSGTPNINAPTLAPTTKTPVDMTSTVGTLKVTLQVAPDKFGTNSVGVLIVDTKTGKPVDGANVHLIVNMVEMDMGTATSDLTGSGNGSGFYTGQIDLLMGGHWTVQVQIRTPQNPNTIQRVSFTFPVTF